MRSVFRPRRTQAQLLVVDVQPRLLPSIHDGQAVASQIVRVCRAAKELEIPVTVTEQYPEGLGHTTAEVAAVTQDAVKLEKSTFSVWADDASREHLGSRGRPQVLLVGIETHVCVQQTALDLLEAQMSPIVLADAVGSRRALDYAIALRGMRRAGVTITTVESAIFEMLESSGTDLFKRILPIVK